MSVDVAERAPMTFPRLLLAASFAVLSLSVVGCAADATDGVDDGADEAESDLSAAGTRLIGSYNGDAGPFHTLELTSVKVGQQNTFAAVVNTGIVCITAPCPSSEVVSGTFTAGAKTITLRPNHTSDNVRELFGRFNYVATDDGIRLYRKDFSETFTEVPNPCAGYTSLSTCVANKSCQVAVGPSACSPDGKICTKDFAFKACIRK